MLRIYTAISIKVVVTKEVDFIRFSLFTPRSAT